MLIKNLTNSNIDSMDSQVCSIERHKNVIKFFIWKAYTLQGNTDLVRHISLTFIYFLLLYTGLSY